MDPTTRESGAEPPGDLSSDDAPPTRRRGQLLVTLWTICVAVVVLDQLTKLLAERYLADRPPVEIVDGLFQLRLVYNPGAAFSIGTNLTWLLTVVATVVVIVVIRISRRLGSRGWAAALGLMLGGAIGNLIDRVLRDPGFARGHVVDFLELPNFPVFNIADSAITSAAVLVVLLGFRGIGVDGRREASAPGGAARG